MNRTTQILVGVAIVGALLAGFIAISESPQVEYEGQKYVDGGAGFVEVGYEGTMANNGDAPAKNVTVTFTIELESGYTFKTVSYLGTIDAGQSKEWDTGLRVSGDDLRRNFEGSYWVVEINANNMEAERHVVLDDTGSSAQNA